jgi:hypothetical protein
MTVREDALAALAADPAIRQAFNATSRGDRSILSASLDSEDSVLVTSTGSPNDELWTILTQHGWMEGATVPSVMKDLMAGRVHRRFTERGRRAVPVILPILLADGRET